jgi:hypothetical protein
MPTNVKFSTYGQGAKVHAKPSDAGAVQSGGKAPAVKRGSGNSMGTRPSGGVRVTPLS